MNHGPGLTFRFLAAQVLVVVISLLVARPWPRWWVRPCSMIIC